jgi:hypothetical protein
VSRRAESELDAERVAIKVYQPCHCEPCKAGRAWYMCNDVMRYQPDAVYACDAIGGRPVRAAVDGVSRLHPGMVLVY